MAGECKESFQIRDMRSTEEEGQWDVTRKRRSGGDKRRKKRGRGGGVKTTR